MFIDFHNRCLISTSITVVGSGEDGNDITIVTPIKSFHNELMSSSDESETVVVVKGFGNVLTKGVTGPTGGDSPTTAVVGVGPEEIAHWAFVGNFLEAVDGANVVEGIDRRGETSVKAEDLIIDKSGKREIVEEVGKEFPNVGVAVLSQAFVVETVNLGDLPRFVITAEDGNAVAVAYFHRDEEGDGLDGIVTPIDVVSHEEVIRIGRVAAYSKEF